MATILIVDDHPHILRLLQRELTATAHQVLTALSGEEALEQVQQQPPALILLDVQLPGICGLAVLQLLKADPATAGIPVVLLSARDHPFEMVRGLELGADWYLTKPFRPGDIALVAGRFLSRDDTVATTKVEQMVGSPLSLAMTPLRITRTQAMEPATCGAAS
jgi:DNA-binding response OmpR family regulator